MMEASLIMMMLSTSMLPQPALGGYRETTAKHLI